MSNIRSEPYWSGDNSEEYLSELDLFARKMYAENCKERIAYGQKPYDDINYYESANYMFLTKKYKELVNS